MTLSEIPMPRHIETVFLDRDGVLNEKMPEGHYVTRWEEFQPLAGVAEAIRKLNHAGIRVIVVSNQRGVALGRMSSDSVESIHAQLQEFLNSHGAHIDAFYFCPHEKNACDCRKPKTGLFQQAVRDFPAIQPETSVVIGDSPSDMEAGRNFGIASILIRGNVEGDGHKWEEARRLAVASFATLQKAVESLVS